MLTLCIQVKWASLDLNEIANSEAVNVQGTGRELYHLFLSEISHLRLG